MADVEVAGLADHSRGAPASCRVDGDRTAQFVFQMLGVDARVHDGHRDVLAVQALCPEFGEEVLDVLPAAYRGVTAAGGHGADDWVGVDADDVRTRDGKHPQPACSVVVLDRSTNQDAGVLWTHGEGERLLERERIPALAGRTRLGRRHGGVGRVELDAR
ncbi:hypothetical protein [Streptomyces sp. ISL-100]|uniref:hypothetical protein n=1 Tax=Streptomyces sp. ISL-100 TaxID=2819173 RepID=UPI001BEC9482|nr:hypothetical protein [Streptomyces sp. ISL-100]